MKVKKRLDVLLTERMFAESRAKAQAIIMSGNVYVDGELLEGATMGEDGTVNMGGQIPMTPSTGGDSSDAIVDWVVGQLQDFTGGELPVTPERYRACYRKVKRYCLQQLYG